MLLQDLVSDSIAESGLMAQPGLITQSSTIPKGYQIHCMYDSTNRVALAIPALCNALNNDLNTECK